MRNRSLLKTYKEITKMLNMIDTTTLYGKRNKVLFTFIYDSGVRASECSNLDINDINIKEKIAKVTGKGNKQRFVLFSEDTAALLDHYIKEIRPIFIKKNTRALFISKFGKRLNRKGIWKIYKPIAIKAGLSTRVHTLRHSYATDLLKYGVDLIYIKELLGHSDILTTQIYTHLDTSFLRKMHEKYLPKLGIRKE